MVLTSRIHHREQLELLEEKLRDFTTLSADPHNIEDKVISFRICCHRPCQSNPQQLHSALLWTLQTIVLTQLDSLRKELVAVAQDSLPYVGSKVGNAFGAHLSSFFTQVLDSQDSMSLPPCL